MNEYRIDLVTEDNPDHPLYSEFFETRTFLAACRKARKILKAKSTSPAEYGALWMRDPDGGTSAEYVETITLEPVAS